MSPSTSQRTSSETHAGQTHLRPTTPTSVHSSSSELGDNDIIPPYEPTAPRTLVLCFDGTGDEFDSDNSNVIKFFSLLKKDDRREQMVYYQAGIGTYTTPQVSIALGQAVSKTLDEMVAWNLDAHVMSGYEFLMQNYDAGDKICLFGFSRGAYTARALAGMLHKVGLLPPENFQQIPFAYKMYTRTDELGWRQSTAFKKAFSIDVDIEFIGVWDTVCSVGIIPHRLPFTASNTAIRTFRHALSLDERRAKFQANHYNHPTSWESKQGTHRGEMPRPSRRRSGMRTVNRIAKVVQERLRNASGATTATAVTATVATPDEAVKIATNATTTAAAATVASVKDEQYTDEDEKAGTTVAAAATVTDTAASAQTSFWGTLRTKMRFKGKRLTEEEKDFDKTANIQGQTDVKEVWFAGCHCDVGGGSVPDEEKHALSRIPLRWMIRECFRTRTGIRFHGELLKEIGLDPATLWPTPPPARAWPEHSVVYSDDAGSPTLPQLARQPPLGAIEPHPRVAVVAATPIEMSHDDVLHAQKEATKVNLSAMFQGPAPPLLPSPCPTNNGRARCETHARDFSTSTAHTLVGGIEHQLLSGATPTGSALAPPGWGPDPNVNEEAEERKDARCEIYDQLTRRPFWWLLELFPIEVRVQRPGDHGWEKHWRLNMGRGRDVPLTERFLVHRSVKYRMEQGELKGSPYKPHARWGSLKPTYVD
ncbi:hypothetical protein BD413DRAFT_609432 [Trametes elegans]|nr:hypothetical protein BD413DRAFT_609432 [Trametes elegans]